MTFTADSVDDQRGRLVLITGANSGLGLETAKVLSAAGADVILACRTESKAQRAMNEIRAAGGKGALHFQALDLSELASVAARGAQHLPVLVHRAPARAVGRPTAALRQGNPRVEHGA